MTLVAGAINLRCCIVMSANLRGVKIAIRMELTMEGRGVERWTQSWGLLRAGCSHRNGHISSGNPS